MVGRYVHPARQKLEKLVGGSLGGKEKTYRAGRTRDHLGCSGCQAGDSRAWVPPAGHSLKCLV